MRAGLVRPLFCALLMLASPAQAIALPDLFPQQAASYLLMRDGTPLAARAADVPRPIASLTKMLTALLLLESGRSLDEVVSVSRDAAAETGSRLKLQVGDQLTLDALLSATLIASANDACHVLADALAGSEAQFVLQMNARASKLGFTHFHAMNACGHDAPGHVATARELAALALTVMQQPRYVELSSLTQKTIHTVGRHPREFKLVNSNALIGRYPGAAGVKTGSTPEAGLCLAAFVLRESHWVLLVLLDAPDRWWTAVAMLDHAFAHAAP